MPHIVVRPLQPQDQEGFFDVRSLTYNDGNPIPEERRNFELTTPYVGLRDGVVEGTFVVLDLTCTRGSAVLPCAGIAAVAVYPHLRRTGVGSAMMTWMIHHARDTGVPMASLYGYREPFYRRFGYEVCGKRVKITAPSYRIPKTAHSLPIRRLKPEDWTQLDPCYTKFATARGGYTLRDEKLWKRVVGENRPLTIYAAGDPVEAYAVVSHNSAFWSTDHIPDVAWTSREGYLALMEILSGLSVNKSSLSWFEPSDSPFYSAFLDQGVEAKIERPVMYRVCDVPGALRMLKTEETGEFTFTVNDEIVPENEGPWRIAFSPAGVEVSEFEGTADLRVNIHRFAQAFLGEPSLADLARNGLVEVQNVNGLRAATQLLPALPVTCADFF